MTSYEKRLASFTSWPHSSPTPQPKDLAAAGLKHIPTTRYSDMVQCPECKLNLDGWEPNDNAVTEHISRSFTCVIAGKLKQRADTARNLKNESTKATQIKNKSKHAKLQADLLAFEAENLEESQHGIIEETSSATLQSDQKSTAKAISQEPSLLPTIEEKGGSAVVKAEQSLLQEKPAEALSLDLEDWVEFGFDGEEIDGWIEI